MKSVNSVFNRSGSTVNSVVRQTSRCFHNIHTPDVTRMNMVTSQIHIFFFLFMGCPCLRLRRVSDISPDRTQPRCRCFPCSPRFAADPRTPISFGDAARGPSVSGSERFGKSFPEMVFFLKKFKKKNGTKMDKKKMCQKDAYCTKWTTIS